jgi:hypothetical protein
MKVKVEFEAIVAKKEQHRYLVELPGSEHVIGVEEWIPAHLCTLILPDFGEGDLVEHVPSGARALVAKYNDGAIFDASVGAAEILISISAEGMYNSVTAMARWKAANCRIVRKAGETE